MANQVKGRRRYHSTLRQEQARRTRRAVLIAARDLFLENGYAATTIAAIAAAAGVSVETVYKTFTNKAGLAKALFDVSIVGDDEPVPMLQRPLVAEIRAEPDARKKVLLYGEHLAAAGPRAGRIQLLIRAAAETDSEARAVWDQMVRERLVGMTAFARDLAEGGYLREGVSEAEARDVLFTYNAVELFDLLVLQRGWEPKRYGRWVAQAIIAALLP